DGLVAARGGGRRRSPRRPARPRRPRRRPPAPGRRRFPAGREGGGGEGTGIGLHVGGLGGGDVGGPTPGRRAGPAVRVAFDMTAAPTTLTGAGHYMVQLVRALE